MTLTIITVSPARNYLKNIFFALTLWILLPFIQYILDQNFFQPNLEHNQ